MGLLNMSTSDTIFLVVFCMFGVQTIAAGVGWWFSTWRTFQDLKDWHAEDKDAEASANTAPEEPPEKASRP